jgi:Fe-S cluster assembly ATPase SufC
MAKYKVQNLQKAFTLNGKPHKVIRGLDLAVDSEEITVILAAAAAGRPLC